jgi:hypothetical protein
LIKDGKISNEDNDYAFYSPEELKRVIDYKGNTNESTKIDDIVDTVNYLDKSYPVIKLTVKNNNNSKEQEITIGSLEMYNEMMEDGKFKGEDAVKLNGDITGYIDFTLDSNPLDIMKEVNSIVGTWATITTPINEGWLDRARAKVSGVIAGAKATAKNTIGKVALRTQAAAQAVKGAATGDMSKANATMKKSEKMKTDPQKEKVAAKASSIINSIYSDLKLLFPDVNVEKLLHSLRNKLVKPAPVAETVKKETFDKLDKVIELYGDEKDVLDDVIRSLDDNTANNILDHLLQVSKN